MTSSSTSMSAETNGAVYEPVAHWPKLPMGVSFYGDATSVAVDSQDNVYVFNRGTDPICVFNPDGDLIRTMLHGTVTRPHGIEIDGDDNIYVVDDDGHYVRKFDQEGVEQFTLGTPGEPAEWQGGGIFNRPTDVAIHPDSGELFVSDGYGNSRVHKFDPDGNHMLSWGEPGTGDGQFSLPHNISMMGSDKVIVADRENFRLQIFTTEGEYVDQWHIHHPMSVTEGKGDDDQLYVGEMIQPPVQRGVPNLGARVSVLSSDGQLLDRLGAPQPGMGVDQFTAPHGISTDSQGNVYVAEVAYTNFYSSLENSGMAEPPRGEIVSLRKWQRVK